jgi:hypothetical protein
LYEQGRHGRCPATAAHQLENKHIPGSFEHFSAPIGGRAARLGKAGLLALALGLSPFAFGLHGKLIGPSTANADQSTTTDATDDTTATNIDAADNNGSDDGANHDASDDSGNDNGAAAGAAGTRGGSGSSGSEGGHSGSGGGEGGHSGGGEGGD